MTELALALDVKSPSELFMWADTFVDLPVIFKIGLRLLPKLNVKDFEALKEGGFKIFIDAKLHDIPSQVRGAVETWGAFGADYLTLHLSGGPQMLSESVAAARSVEGLELLGVSVLTSLSSSDLAAMGFTPDPAAQVKKLVEAGLDAGMRSFVCSVGESRLILDTAAARGLQARTVCPGLKFTNGRAQADQSRSFTVEEALEAGCGMLVMGRAVFEDADPRGRVEGILKLL